MSHNYLEVSPDGHGGLLIRTDAKTAVYLVEGLERAAAEQAEPWWQDCAFNIRTALQRFKIPTSG